MPTYLFANPENENDIIEVVQAINEDHSKHIKDGKIYLRIFTIPNMAVDTICDPNSASDFVKVTNKKGTIGELMDRSAELSAKRADKDGLDPVKEKFYENYSKTRAGSVHPEVKKRKLKEKAAKAGIILED